MRNRLMWLKIGLVLGPICLMQSRSWEANSSSAIQKIPGLFYIKKFIAYFRFPEDVNFLD
jgi:hypothetical protein